MAKKILVSLLLALVWLILCTWLALVAFAETLPGLDLLGLGNKNWPIQETLDAYPNGYALGVFDFEFGESIPKVKKLLDTGKVPAVRVHIWWSSAHKIVPIDVLKKRLPLWEALAKQYPQVKFYVSHSCEYLEKNVLEIKKRVDLVVKLAPSTTPVQTPMHSPVISGYKVEVHGSAARAKAGQLASTDGHEIMQMDSSGWIGKNAQADIAFLWGARFNLREVGTTAAPKDRVAYPSAAYIKGIARLSLSKGNAPSSTFLAKPLVKPQLWKTFAEDYPGEGDKRANRPVAMMPFKVSKLDVVTFDNKLVCQLKLYPDKNPHQLERYYSGGSINLTALQIAEKAKALSGSEYIWLRAAGKYYGPIPAAFRHPFYHQ